MHGDLTLDWVEETRSKELAHPDWGDNATKSGILQVSGITSGLLLGTKTRHWRSMDHHDGSWRS
jgi:hypothetical protein